MMFFDGFMTKNDKIDPPHYKIENKKVVTKQAAPAGGRGLKRGG